MFTPAPLPPQPDLSAPTFRGLVVVGFGGDPRVRAPIQADYRLSRESAVSLADAHMVHGRRVRDEHVRELVVRHLQGVPMAVLARELGVPVEKVRRAFRCEAWDVESARVDGDGARWVRMCELESDVRWWARESNLAASIEEGAREVGATPNVLAGMLDSRQLRARGVKRTDVFSLND